MAFVGHPIFVDVTGDITVKLHVPLLLVFVLLAFTLAHQGRCGCEQSELLICSRFLEHIFGLDFYTNLSIFLDYIMSKNDIVINKYNNHHRSACRLFGVNSLFQRVTERLHWYKLPENPANFFFSATK